MAEMLNLAIKLRYHCYKQAQGCGALMKNVYPSIKQQYDVWHLAKSVVNSYVT